MRGGRIKSLDGLKGLMANVIIIYHFSHFSKFMDGQMLPLNQILLFVYRYGYLCVECFFVISGFVLEYTFADRSERITFSQFLKKRVFRLWPLFFFTTMITGILQLVLYGVSGDFFIHPVSLWGFFLNFFGLQVADYTGHTGDITFNGPAWYVGILVWMYILYYHLHKSKYKREGSVICILIGMLILSGGYQVIFFNSCMARGLVGFFSGVLLCQFYKKHKGEYTGPALCVVAASLGMICVFRMRIVGNLNLYFSLIFWPAFLLYCLDSHWLSKVLGNKIFVQFGSISYDLLLWHFPVEILFVIIYCTKAVPGMHFYSLATFVIRYILTIMVAIFSKRYLNDRISLAFGNIMGGLTDL